MPKKETTTTTTEVKTELPKYKPWVPPTTNTTVPVY